MPSVLFVVSSACTSMSGKPNIGFYLPEAAHPYYILRPHANIDFASPLGPNPPIDEGSVREFKDELSVRFLNDPVVKEKLANAKKLSEVRATEYDAVFYVGGHAPVIDLPNDQDNIKLVKEFWETGKVVSAICHGPAAFVNVTDAAKKSIFDGKTVTALSNAEEQIIDGAKEVPFSVEDEIVALGGNYVKADEPFGEKVVVDGQLITGQNPASALAIGEAILNAIQS